ncbi:hypothetical protein L7F22_045467 [Adiantum nelumboides]|nr:hypothetical protein [Adiantum nelumboides]
MLYEEMSAPANRTRASLQRATLRGASTSLAVTASPSGSRSTSNIDSDEPSKSSVYSQPTFEVLEGKASDAKVGRFSARNLLPRLVLRGSFVAITTFISAMLPFFGDINALIGAFGFLPLDFIFPMIFYNIVFQPSRRSAAFWFNTLIAFAFVLVCIIGCIAAVRQIVLDANNYKLFANL